MTNKFGFTLKITMSRWDEKKEESELLESYEVTIEPHQYLELLQKYCKRFLE